MCGTALRMQANFLVECSEARLPVDQLVGPGFDVDRRKDEGRGHTGVELLNVTLRVSS